MENAQKGGDGLSGLWPGLIVLLLVPSLIWIWFDRSVWRWDAAWYGEVSTNLYTALNSSNGEWAKIVWTALPSRAPGLVWLGEFFLPIGISFGRPEFGMLLCTWLIQAASALVVYRSATILFADAVAGFASVAFVCSAPLFAGMTQTFMTEPLQGLGCALFLYVLCGADRRPVVRSALMLALAGILASLGKITSGLYIFCPAVLFVGWSMRQRSEARHSKPGWLDILLSCILGASVFIFGFWICTNFGEVFRHFREASSGEYAEYYGSRAGLLQKIPYWTRAVLMSFWHPMVWPALAVGAAFAMWSLNRHRRMLVWGDYVAIACAANIALSILVFSLNVTEDSRFLFPLFPCVGLVLAWLMRAIPKPAAKVFSGLALAQLLLVFSLAFGAASQRPGLSPYLMVMDTRGRRLADLQEALANTCQAEANRGMFVAGLDLSYFNARSLSFYSKIASLRSGLRCEYESLGYAANDAGQAWTTLLAERPHGILFLKDEMSRISGSDPFNRVSGAIYDRVRTSPAFRLQHLSSAPNILLFRNSTDQWGISSALFGSEVSISAEANGSTTWRIHPASRRSDPQTIVRFLGDLPTHARVSGKIKSCDARCQGVALEFEVAGRQTKPQVVQLAAPVEDQSFAVTVDSTAGGTLLMRLRSLDDSRDNIDFCWLTIVNVRVEAAP